MMRRCQSNQLLSGKDPLIAVKILETLHHFRQSLVVGRLVSTDINFESSQRTGLNALFLAALIFAEMQIIRQS